MSISLATKGIIFVLKGGAGGYTPVPVCEPEVVSYEYGEKHMEGKELKPKMGVKPRVREYKRVYFK